MQIVDKTRVMEILDKRNSEVAVTGMSLLVCGPGGARASANVPAQGLV